MTVWQPRHRRSRKVPLFVRIGAVVVACALGVIGFVAVGDEREPSSAIHAQIDSPSASARSSSAPASPDASPPASERPSPSPTSGDETEAEDRPAVGAASGGQSNQAGQANTNDNAQSPSASSGETDSRPDGGESDAPSQPAEPKPSTPGDPSSPSEPSGEQTLRPPSPAKPSPAPEPPPSMPSAPTLSNYEHALVDAVNGLRSRYGCRDLRVDGRLVAASRQHSADMRNRHFFSHINPDGKDPQDRAAAFGYDAPVGENLSYGLRSASLVLTTWKLFPGDRDKLVDCGYSAVGVGVEVGLLGAWWTLKLGRG